MPGAGTPATLGASACCMRTTYPDGCGTLSLSLPQQTLCAPGTKRPPANITNCLPIQMALHSKTERSRLPSRAALRPCVGSRVPPAPRGGNGGGAARGSLRAPRLCTPVRPMFSLRRSQSRRSAATEVRPRPSARLPTKDDTATYTAAPKGLSPGPPAPPPSSAVFISGLRTRRISEYALVPGRLVTQPSVAPVRGPVCRLCRRGTWPRGR